ncbi:putative odorant receptor 92a [Onthophagus taurus]|uniref:putative odorant receptor 92a n=1 Tax=Onthophagus taurus TaxID=166361 RepID=UPI0039BE693D
MMSITFRFMMGGVCLFYVIFPFFDDKDLPIPFSLDLGKYKIVMHIFQVVALTIAAWNVSCIDLTFVTIMGICAAQLEILCIRLQNFATKARKISYHRHEFDRNVGIFLKECVIHYDGIISLVAKVNNMFSFITFFQYFLGMPIVCNIVLQLTLLLDIRSTEFVMTIMLFSTMVTQMTMYSWFGNEVIVKSDKIIESAYLSEWYLCPTKHKRTLFIIMERAKKPLAVSAGGFTSVSLTALLVIIKWSYSIYALVRTALKQ